jgi:hypothetical protein
MNDIAAAYLLKTKGWTAEEYRLDVHPSTPEDYVIAAVHLNDGGHPGAGKSVLVRISKSSHEVVCETGFQ